MAGFSFGTSGGGGFQPSAQDAYTALMARMPGALDQSLALRRQRAGADIAQTEAGTVSQKLSNAAMSEEMRQAPKRRRDARNDAERARNAMLLREQQQGQRQRLASAGRTFGPNFVPGMAAPQNVIADYYEYGAGNPQGRGGGGNAPPPQDPREAAAASIMTDQARRDRDKATAWSRG